MPRALWLSLAIVAAFTYSPAAAPLVEDALIGPQVADLADRLGSDPARDRARFMSEIARLLFPTPDVKPIDLTARRADLPAGAGAVRVPVPLPAAFWSRVVFRRTVPPDQLVATILSDRRAALMCRGFAGLDDETLQYFNDHPALVSFLYERAPGTFAAFAGSIKIRSGRVVPAGGDRAAPLWEAIVKAPPANPDAFVRLLFTSIEGRLAYLYDVVDAAEPPAAAFALGLWMTNDASRLERFRALADACTRSYREWHVEEHPFTRPLGDLAMLLLRIRLQPSGAPAAPSGRAFWAVALDADPNLSSSTGEANAIDAGWLVGATETDMFARTERLDQFSFGQRVFAAVADADSGAAADVVRAYRRYRMLLVTLDRMGITSVPTYAAAIQRADELGSAQMTRRFWTLSEFQGAMALVFRMRRVGSLSLDRADALVRSLAAVPMPDGEYEGRLADWIRTSLGPALPNEASWEARTILAMAGPDEGGAAPHIEWEGQTYRLDLRAAERRRLELVREKQAGHTLDMALTVDTFARTLHAPTLTIEAARTTAGEVRTMAEESAARLHHPAVNLPPPGVIVPRDAYDWLIGAAEDLDKIARPSDLRRTLRISSSLEQLADVMLGNALLSLAYAGEIGDPEGTALLTANVSLRHDYGLGRRDTDSRDRMAWAMPRQDFQPGVPWHLTGSLLGIDIALAPLNLHRLSIDRIADVPKMSSIERDALTQTVGLMDPHRTTDADRDRIAAAIARGRARVQSLGSGGTTLGEIADTLGFDGWRRRAVGWILEHDPQTVAEQFSLADFLTLGGGAQGANLDAWGPPGLYTQGCACLAFPNARAWRVLEGRPQLPVMAATMGDLNLAVALELAETKLPAAMARVVLTVGLADFIDETSMANSNDWRAMSLQAQGLRRQRFEDYVSAAAAVDGPLVPEGLDLSDEPR